MVSNPYMVNTNDTIAIKYTYTTAYDSVDAINSTGNATLNSIHDAHGTMDGTNTGTINHTRTLIRDITSTLSINIPRTSMIYPNITITTSYYY